MIANLNIGSNPWTSRLRFASRFMKCAFCCLVFIHFLYVSVFSSGESAGISSTLEEEGSVDEFDTVPKRPLYFSYIDEFDLQPKLRLNDSHNFIVYVMSAIHEVSLREAIRATWADLININKYEHHEFAVQIFFVVGGTQFVPNDVQNDVIKEHGRFCDILSIASLRDSYNNLTEKSIYALHYTTRMFNTDKLDYIFKVDSDNFVNIFKVLNLAWKLILSGNVPDFICYKREETKVLRTGKYVEVEQRYQLETYPEYCSGPGYVASSKVLPRLMAASRRVPILQSEDVMLTGVGLQGTGDVDFYQMSRRNIFFDQRHWGKFPVEEIVDRFHERFYAHELPSTEWGKVYDKLLQYYL